MNNLDGHLIAIFYFISSLEESIRINELKDGFGKYPSKCLFYVVEIYVREIILHRQCLKMDSSWNMSMNFE